MAPRFVSTAGNGEAVVLKDGGLLCESLVVDLANVPKFIAFLRRSYEAPNS